MDRSVERKTKREERSLLGQPPCGGLRLQSKVGQPSHVIIGLLGSGLVLFGVGDGRFGWDLICERGC